MIHNLTGLVEYPAGMMGLLLLAVGLKNEAQRAARRLALIIAACIVIGFVMMATPDQAHLRGLWQRLADYSMFLCVAYLGILLPRAS